MANTFGLCTVCFQSTFGMCCPTCSNLLRCISGPEEPSRDQSSATDDASSFASSSASSSSDSVAPMDVDDSMDEEVTILAQDPYNNGATPDGAPSPPINFGHITVQRALSLSSLDDTDRERDGVHPCHAFPGHEEPAFSDDVKLSQKMSVRILVKGHQPYEHQTNILRGKLKRPTRGQLAAILAKEVQRFTEREQQHGRTLRHDDKVVNPSRMLLLGVHHVSKSSLQPIIGVSAS